MRFLCFILFSLLLSKSNAQIIKCSDTKNTPLSKVHLKVFTLDGLLLQDGFTNEKGVLEQVALRSNMLIIKAKHFGYKDYLDTIPLFKDTLKIELFEFSFPLDEIVITAQIGESSRKNSINNVISISKEEIEEFNTLNLGDLLNQQALFDIQIDPVLGASIEIQGMSGNNVNILVDGIPVIGRKGGQIDVSQLNLSNIEKIEIVKGPSSISYGSNSTGGVINLISKRNIQNNQIILSNYYENIGLNQLNIDLNKKIKQQQFNINIGCSNFIGYSEDTLRAKEWKPKRQYFGQIMWVSKIKENDIRLKSYFFDEKIIEMGNENYPPFDGTALDNHYLTYRNTNDLSIVRKQENYSLNTLVSQSSTKFKRVQYSIDLLTDEELKTNNPDFTSEDLFTAFYSRVEYNRLNWSKISAQFGLDYRNDMVSGGRIQSGKAESFEWAFFSKTELKLTNNLKGQIGIRIPYHSIYSAPLTPSLQLHFSKSPKLQYRASYARGFRAPSIKELFMEFIDSNHNIIGNSELDAEYSHAFNSSIVFTPYQKNSKYVQIDLEASLQYLNNKIELAQIENTTNYTYFNISKAKYYGLNTTIDSKISNSSKVSIGWNIYKTEFNESLKPSTFQNITLLYKYTNLKYKFGGNINFKISPEITTQRFENDKLISVQQEPYELINLNMHKTLSKYNSTISFGMKNLMNVKNILSIGNGAAHSSSESLISWGRTFFVNLKITLK
tara:strand:- start:456 stop:2630 length:2175 start_codon:yes stop_codon:yes gene_type:complete